MNHIEGCIHIPPISVKVNTISSVMVIGVASLITINYIAEDVLASTECGKEMLFQLIEQMAKAESVTEQLKATTK